MVWNRGRPLYGSLAGVESQDGERVGVHVRGFADPDGKHPRALRVGAGVGGALVSLVGGGNEGDQSRQRRMDVDVGTDSGLEVGAVAGSVGGVVVGHAVSVRTTGSAIFVAAVFAVPDVDS